MTKLSVIIPVYNAEKYLVECLESVLNQSLKEIEVICVDDGSTDTSMEILKDFEARDNRVKILKQKNGHAGVARNNGLSIATGEYVHFLDADDYVLDYAYESLYYRAHENKLDCLKCRTVAFNMQVNKFTSNYLYMLNNLNQEDFNCFLRNDEDGPLYYIGVVPWNGIYRREFLEEYQIKFNSLFCVNDRSFFWRVATNAKRFMISRDWLVVHRIGQEKSLVGKRAKYFDCQFKSLQTTSDQLTVDKIDSKIVELVMKREISDLREWYRRLCNDSQYGESICKDTKKFVEEYQGNCSEMLRETYQKKMLNVSGTVSADKQQPEVLFYRDYVENPKISVIIPVYNAEKYLHYCLDSVIHQTLEEIEIICVDDGSSDSSEIILKEYAAIDKRIRIIKQNNRYAGVARNRGIKEARGEYLLFMDSDDFLDESLCEKTYEKAVETVADIVIYGAMKYDTRNGNVENTNFLNYKFIPDLDVFSRKNTSGNVLILTSTNPWLRLYRREFVVKENIYFQEFHHSNDIYFSLVTMAVAERISCVKEDLVYYRVGQSHNLQSSKEKEPTLFLDAYEAAYNELIKRGIFDEVEKGFINRLIFSCNHNLSTVKYEESWKEIYHKLCNKIYINFNLFDHPKDYYIYSREVNKLQSVEITNKWLDEFNHRKANLQNLAIEYLEREKDDAFFDFQIAIDIDKEGTGYKGVYYVYEVFYCYLEMQKYYVKKTSEQAIEADDRVKSGKMLELAKTSYANLKSQEKLAAEMLPFEKRELLFLYIIEPYKRKTEIDRLCNENENLKLKLDKAKTDNKKIKNSVTYKIGRIITWIPRRIKRLLVN